MEFCHSPVYQMGWAAVPALMVDHDDLLKHLAETMRDCGSVMSWMSMWKAGARSAAHQNKKRAMSPANAKIDSNSNVKTGLRNKSPRGVVTAGLASRPPCLALVRCYTIVTSYACHIAWDVDLEQVNIGSPFKAQMLHDCDILEDFEWRQYI